MADAFADPDRIEGYHAHIYYDPATRAEGRAAARKGSASASQAKLGSWHDEPVGPHPVSMYQVAFAVDEFPRLVPWLMLNRDGLDVLVHPLDRRQPRRPHPVCDVARHKPCRCGWRPCGARPAAG